MRTRRVSPLLALGAVGCLVNLLLTAVLVAQTGSARAALSGVVVDSQGGVMAGVAVTVTNRDTRVARPDATTNDAGVFELAALDPGTYTIKASRTGFTTTVVDRVRVAAATPATVRITLNPGQVTQEVTVQAPAELIQTRSAMVASTITGDQLRTLPLITKSALNYVTFLPGVDTGGQHVPRLNTTISGLPQSALAISIDGVNTQDNYNKSSDGFFSIIAPSVDAVQEVTTIRATPGADASGQGAVQIKFVTRSGTSQYVGSAYEYFRHPRLNANTYFNIVNNLPKNAITLNQYGANIGGPLRMPGFAGDRRAFFFTNYEEFHLPADVTRTRVVLSDAARSGVFQYNAGGTVRSVDVLALAAQKGQISSADPTIAKLLADIAAATQTTGTLTPNADPNTSSFVFNASSLNTRHMPNARLDFNLTPAQRLTTTYYFQRFDTNPDVSQGLDPRFPGFPSHGAQYSNRHAGSASLRSIASPNLVNEAVFGLLWTPVYFGADATAASFQNQGGYALGFRPSPNAGFAAFNLLDIPTAGSSTNNPSSAAGNNPQARNSADWNVDDTLNWQRGRHSLQFGGNFLHVKAWTRDQQLAPAITFGVDVVNDPANGLFTTANFPGASAGSLNDARHLYALLTGRVTSIQGQLALNAATNQYVYNGVAERTVHMNEMGFFAQDSWRTTPTFTVNYGLRYELQLPMVPENSLYTMSTVADACGVSGVGSGFSTGCNIFSPGTLTGVPTPGYRQYDANSPGYKTDTNNVAPSVGVAWQPNLSSGIGRVLLGDPEGATVRAGYTRAFTREGIGGVASGGLSQVYEANPGLFAQLTRNANNGNLIRPGETSPLLLSQTSRLGPPDFVATPSYPLQFISRSNALSLFDPSWEVGYADSYSAGFQRALSSTTVFEASYVGTRGKALRDQENWNEVNITENGFFNEFKQAQLNLYANRAAGRGNTLAYYGPGTGTAPLPILLAFFNGLSAAQAGDPSKYTGANWTNAQLLPAFYQLNPAPAGAAAILNSSAVFRANAATAGLPVNFFQLNPDVGAINVQVSKGFTRYDSLQLDLRRHLANGFAYDVNYTYGRRWQSRLDSLHSDRYLVPSTAGVPHALKMNAAYELPFGRERRFLRGASAWQDALVGGWTMAVTGRVQSGQLLDFGNVRLVGMSVDELQDAIAYRIDTTTVPGAVRVYNLPQDIIDNTIKAFNVGVDGYTTGTPTGRYFAPASGPDCIQQFRGDCAPADVIVTAPVFTRFDLSARKTFRTGGRTRLSFEANVFNLFNAINFNPVLGVPSPNPDAYRVTTSYSDLGSTFDPGSRTGQIVLRFDF